MISEKMKKQIAVLTNGCNRFGCLPFKWNFRNQCFVIDNTAATKMIVWWLYTVFQIIYGTYRVYQLKHIGSRLEIIFQTRLIEFVHLLAMSFLGILWTSLILHRKRNLLYANSVLHFSGKLGETDFFFRITDS